MRNAFATGDTGTPASATVLPLLRKEKIANPEGAGPFAAGVARTEPLRMVDTGFNPPASKLDRIAATEFEANPPRGMVRGSVHDENAWSLGGVAGHAGIFSTAGDPQHAGVLVTCEAGGVKGQARVRIVPPS